MNTAVKRRIHPGLFSLAVSAFAIGVAEFLVVGILPTIATNFSVSIEAAGALVSLYALALALGTPLAVLTVSRLPHKPVLLGLMALFLGSNLLAAISSTYEMLLLARIITACAHGTFFAVGASMASSLAAKGQAGRAIAIMFAGLTLAMVIGVPLGSYLGNLVAWQLPFFAVAGLAAVALLALLLWLPANSAAGGVGKIGTQLSAIGNPAILTMMVVTILGFGSSFAAFTFITPILTTVTGFSTGAASILLLLFGVATFAGNLLGGQLTERFGWQRTIMLLLALLALTQLVLALVLSSPLATAIVLFLWGLFAFGLSPSLQAGMLATAQRYTPQAVDFASGLNISAFNFGISGGAFVGGMMVAQGLIGATPWIGVIGAILAQLPLAWLGRLEARRLKTSQTSAVVQAVDLLS